MTASANWRDEAACRHADTDLFFPVGSAGPALRQVDEAKRICRTCPVQARCLAWALDLGVTDGVWGGTTEDERRAIRRLTRKTEIIGKMTMAMVVTQQSTENMEYVRKLLKQKEPGFSAALELAADLVERDLRSPKMPRDISTPADP
jgi:WhiB family transcriptional regulator, redox-sensing transcriptional regulator